MDETYVKVKGEWMNEMVRSKKGMGYLFNEVNDFGYSFFNILKPHLDFGLHKRAFFAY